METIKRLEYIDLAKGLAILLVVIGHLLQYNFLGLSSNVVFNFIYGFHMPVFMFLSGYVAALSRHNVKYGNILSFCKRKSVSLLLPFCIWGIIINPLLLNHVPVNQLGNIILNLFLNPQTGAWFIIVLFCIQCYYLTICLLSNLIQMREKMYADFVAFILIGVMLFLVSLYIHSSIYISLKYFLMFMLGYFVKMYGTRFFFNRYVLGISILIFSFLSWRFVFGESSKGLQLLVSIPASVIILNMSLFIQMDNDVSKKWLYRKFLYLGQNSLMIYLTHYILVMICNGVKLNVGYINSVPLFFILSILAFIICWLCIVIGNTISKVPFCGLLIYGKK